MNLSPPLQRIILKYIPDLLKDVIKNRNFHILSYILKIKYDITYLNCDNCLTSIYSKNCFHNNKLIINFKQKNHMNEILSILSDYYCFLH
jgi:hypothetical protein